MPPIHAWGSRHWPVSCTSRTLPGLWQSPDSHQPRRDQRCPPEFPSHPGLLSLENFFQMRASPSAVAISSTVRCSQQSQDLPSRRVSSQGPRSSLCKSLIVSILAGPCALLLISSLRDRHGAPLGAPLPMSADGDPGAPARISFSLTHGVPLQSWRR